jgi:hypothetical protein
MGVSRLTEPPLRIISVACVFVGGNKRGILSCLLGSEYRPIRAIGSAQGEIAKLQLAGRAAMQVRSEKAGHGEGAPASRPRWAYCNPAAVDAGSTMC